MLTYKPRKQVSLKEVFGNEPKYMTPFVAEYIDLLSDDLNLNNLIIDGVEAKENKDAKQRSIDILCHDDFGRYYVIENQFGKADADHFGKTFSYYLPGVCEKYTNNDISKVYHIWIADEFDEAMKHALSVYNMCSFKTFAVKACCYSDNDGGFDIHFSPEIIPDYAQMTVLDTNDFLPSRTPDAELELSIIDKLSAAIDRKITKDGKHQYNIHTESDGWWAINPNTCVDDPTLNIRFCVHGYVENNEEVVNQMYDKLVAKNIEVKKNAKSLAKKFNATDYTAIKEFCEAVETALAEIVE